MTGRKRAVTKSGTGTWSGLGVVGLGVVGLGVVGFGSWDSGTRGRNKQHLTFALNL